jgi:hypothetical protein
VHKGLLMAPWNRRRGQGWRWLVLVGMAAAAAAQTCQSAPDMDPPVRAGLEGAAKRYFDMSARTDTAALQQNSIPAVAASFAGIETAVKENQSAFAGAQVTTRPPFLLVAEGNEPLARAEFLCGIFGKSGQTASSAVFVFNGLPPGKYGVVILDVTGNQGARSLTLILRETGTEWKLAGFYARPSQVRGHDGAWFAERARDFHAKGQSHNAWLYYHQAIILSTPVDFMSTLATDKLYDEAQSVQPADLPSPDHPLMIAEPTGPAESRGIEQQKPTSTSAGQSSAGKAGKTFAVTQMFPLAVDDKLYLVLKYQSSDVSNTAQTFQDNLAIIRGAVAKFPQFREAFDGVVARAVEPSGRDYGSLLLMKDIK